MIDFFLLLVVYVLVFFGTYLAYLAYVKQDRLQLWQLIQGVIILSIGFTLIPSAFTIARFNPELHDCTKWNWKGDSYKAAFDECYSTCNFMRYEFDINTTKEECSNYCRFGKERCVSWQPKLKESKMEVKNLTDEAEVNCLLNPSDTIRCECMGIGDVFVPANETQLILPEGTTSLPSGFAGGLCNYGKGFYTSCTAYNYTKTTACIKAIPKTEADFCRSNPSSTECVSWQQKVEKLNFSGNSPEFAKRCGDGIYSYDFCELMSLKLNNSWYDSSTSPNSWTQYGMGTNWQINLEINDTDNYPCLNLTDKECFEKGKKALREMLLYAEIVKNASDTAYCNLNPSDTEKCECVKNSSVTSFEYGIVNYSDIIEVNYGGYVCKELINDDSYYLLQRSRRKFVSSVPINAERVYDCNIPCNDSKGCYFETKCFSPLNLSILKYAGIQEEFPVYCTNLIEDVRVTANITYSKSDAPIQVKKNVCVEAVPK